MATRTSNGTDTDTQTQINASAPGDTVIVPNGSFTWSTGITINKAIKVTGASVGGVSITMGADIFALVTITPAATGILEFANFKLTAGNSVTSRTGHLLFISYVSQPPVAQPKFLIHDCVFASCMPGVFTGTTGQLLSQVLWSQNGGVMWNCTFNIGNSPTAAGGATSFYDEPIQFKHSALDRWASLSTLGSSGDPNGDQNTYVEDCTFNNYYTNGTDVDDGSRTVIRHCTFNESVAASHGYDTSPLGVRHWELYNNHFVYPHAVSDPNATNVNAWIIMRGGTGIVTNNTFQPQASTNWGSGRASINWLSDAVTQIRCYSTYPIPRAAGQGWNGGSGTYSEANPWGTPHDNWSTNTGYFTDPIYAWNNHTDNTTQSGNADTQSWLNNVGCPGGFTSQQFIVAGQDFFYNGTGSPSAGAKPGWSPYTYPHPLRLGTGSGFGLAIADTSTVVALGFHSRLGYLAIADTSSVGISFHSSPGTVPIGIYGPLNFQYSGAFVLRNFPVAIRDTSTVLALGFRTSPAVFPVRIGDTSTVVKLGFEIGLRVGIHVADVSQVLALGYKIVVPHFSLAIGDTSTVLALGFQNDHAPVPPPPAEDGPVIVPPYTGLPQQSRINVSAQIAYKSVREEGPWVMPPYASLFPPPTQAPGEAPVPPPVKKTDVFSAQQTWPL